jgi:phosphoribosylaminoimidazole carboxylase PurE protein
MKRTEPRVAIIMGSDSDLPVMQDAAEALKLLGVAFEMRILSAHRTPDEVVKFAKHARRSGFAAIIAGAGGAAHLPGMAAAHTELPVIGVPVPIGHLLGADALLSIVQMPRGVPVATVAIGNAWNAGVLAAQILGARDPRLLDRMKKYKAELRAAVLKKKIAERP